jgi:hypothetical protein
MNTIYRKIRKKIDKALLLLLFASFVGSVQAQEILTGLHTNTVLMKEAQKYEKRVILNQRVENTPILLPDRKSVV